MKKLIFSIIGILIVLVIFVCFIPAPISPVAYAPAAPKELVGVLAPNKLLQNAELLGLGKIDGPEEVVVDSQGRIYAGTLDGKIMMLTLDGKLDVTEKKNEKTQDMHTTKYTTQTTNTHNSG